MRSGIFIVLFSIIAWVHGRPQLVARQQQFTGVATFNNYAVRPNSSLYQRGAILTDIQAQTNVNCGGPKAPCKLPPALL